MSKKTSGFGNQYDRRGTLLTYQGDEGVSSPVISKFKDQNSYLQSKRPYMGNFDR